MRHLHACLSCPHALSRVPQEHKTMQPRPTNTFSEKNTGIPGNFYLVNVVLNPDAVHNAPQPPCVIRCRHPNVFSNASQLAPAITQQGQWYRLLTPVVLHGSFTHLAVNSMSFSSVGPVVRKLFKIGVRSFLCVEITKGACRDELA